MAENFVMYMGSMGVGRGRGGHGPPKFSNMVQYSRWRLKSAIFRPFFRWPPWKRLAPLGKVKNVFFFVFFSYFSFFNPLPPPPPWKIFCWRP